MSQYYYNGHWDFPEKMGCPEYVGFIYVIKDTYFDKLYLGKKLYRGTGNLNKGVESDWKKYISSSKAVREMLFNRPKEEFQFICIEQYRTKGTLSYAETWSLCRVEAPTSARWYNRLIEKVSWAVKEPISKRHKERLLLTLEESI
jgi:hypothetical protein